MADSTITEILLNAPNEQDKGTIDARCQWPIAVFESVCECHNNYGGVDCSKCDFGWTGENCEEKAQVVTRKPFQNLNEQEKRALIQATIDLKSEMGQWSVIVGEPHHSTGTVTLQDVSTYNFLVQIHSYVSRDKMCKNVNSNITVDFGHIGPVFPVWHRRYLLIVEREYQRIMDNSSFGFPYWQWEINDKTPFSQEYFGNLSIDIPGAFEDPQNWSTICDLPVRNDTQCKANWEPCNPNDDLERDMINRTLQRGNQETYLPHLHEVMIAIAAPLYYDINNLRDSFSSRLEGVITICSKDGCVGCPDSDKQYMHNNVHNWIGGHMAQITAAVNDPIFSLHHCNIDRILESWMKKNMAETPPLYYPVAGGHPGHNMEDYMVPFFPLIKVSQQYKFTEDWGYKYEELVPAAKNMPCNYESNGTCSIRDADGTYFNITRDFKCLKPNSSTTNNSANMLLLPLSLLLLLLS